MNIHCCAYFGGTHEITGKAKEDLIEYLGIASLSCCEIIISEAFIDDINIYLSLLNAQRTLYVSDKEVEEWSELNKHPYLVPL